MRFLTACLSGLLLSSTAMADDHADFRALAWLEGCWAGEGLGGEVSECWMSSPDGRMTGVFQIVSDGELQFTEILMLGEVDGVSGYHVKHFDADFTGWEERDEEVSFAFISARGTRAEFEGLTYDLGPEGVLLVTLMIGQADGSTARAEFRLRRIS